ncbi:hypothetical protein Emag_000071 [Eimeria magna]
MTEELTAPDGKMMSEANCGSSCSKEEQQQQHDDGLADIASFPSLEEQNRQLSEARASLQQQQERRRQQQQQQQQQQQGQSQQLDQPADAGACEPESEVASSHHDTCRYLYSLLAWKGTNFY